MGGAGGPPALSPVVFSRRHAGQTVRRGASVGQDGSVEAGVGTQGGGWAVSAACWGGVLQLLRPSESEEPTNKKKEGGLLPALYHINKGLGRGLVSGEPNFT